MDRRTFLGITAATAAVPTAAFSSEMENPCADIRSVVVKPGTNAAEGRVIIDWETKAISITDGPPLRMIDFHREVARLDEDRLFNDEYHFLKPWTQPTHVVTDPDSAVITLEPGFSIDEEAQMLLRNGGIVGNEADDQIITYYGSMEGSYV